MNGKDIAYTVALCCLTALGGLGLWGSIWGPNQATSHDVCLLVVGTAMGAIAGVVKQPREDPAPIQPGERRTAELEAK
jgi:hypothetical protein